MKPVESNTRQPQTKKDKKRNLCPFLSSPFKDCYSLDMNSNKISMVIYYCQNRYEECDIYKRITKPKQKKLAGLLPSEKRRP
jgi:hypothetical protein